MLIQESDSIVFHSEHDQVWMNSEGKLHRVGGPARIRPNGYQVWYVNDKYHRVGGPAVIEFDGSKYWYLNDERHREGGPAIIESSGYEDWYLKGKKVTQEEAER